MGVIFEAGYTLPGADEPLTHSRIAHSGNWLTGGTVAASTTATDFYADAPNNSLTYEKWKGTAAATWEYNHGETAECDYCIIAGHTMGTSSATFKVQYENAGWVDLCAAASPSSNEPIIVIFEPQTRQRWRVNISAGTPEVSVIRFGKALQMERPLYGEYTPVNLARQTELRSNYSESGEFLGRTKQRTHSEFSMSWRMLSRAWVLANWLPAIKSFETEPFLVAPDPSTFDEAAFCQTTGPVPPISQGANGYLATSLSIRARGYD